MINPKNFNDSSPDSWPNSMQASFEDLCTSMEDVGIDIPHKLTVYKFKSKIRYFKKKKSKSKRK